MTHYELLGLRPEATDAGLREAIAAARASWSRRRDASAAPAAAARASAALARLDEAARDLGTPELRRQYDESALPLDVLHRIRALRGYPDPAEEPAPDAAQDPVAPAVSDSATATAAAPSPTGSGLAGQDRLATEQAIQAEAERRREARRQEEERAAHERTAWDSAAAEGPGQATPIGAESTAATGGSPARPERLGGRKRRKPRLRALRVDIDWRTVSILALATAAGVGIALVPVALLTSGRPDTALLSGAATASETPRVLPVTGVSATISQPPAASRAATAAGDASAAGSTAAATAAFLAASDDEPVPPAYAAAAAQASLTARAEPMPAAQAPGTPVAAPAPATFVPISQQPPVLAAQQPGGAAQQTGIAAQQTGNAAQLTGGAAQQATAAPESAHSILRRAYAAYSGGLYEESLRLYDQVLARKPDDPIARVARALTMLALSRPHDAEVECRIAIKVQPTFPEAHFNLGIALHRQHRDDEAVAAFRRFVDLAPDDKAAPQARGFIARWTMAHQTASSSRRASGIQSR